MELDVAVLGGDPLEPGAQALIELDHVDRRDPRRQLAGQRALATADLEHHIRAAELGLADDRAEQVGVGEEVLP